MRFFKEEDILNFDGVQFQYLRTSLKGNLFTIILNRPEKRNAFTPTMANEIAFALIYAKYTEVVRCIVVKAEGPVFCAGADLNAFHDAAADFKNQTLPEPTEQIKLADVFSSLYKPCIAQVEGPVLAGGFLIICGCTFVISVEDATYTLPEVKRGIWPMQVMASLLAILPKRKVLEMCITGKTYSADEALDLGLVTSIYGREFIEEEVRDLALSVCSNAPYAIQSGMKAFDELFNIPEAERQTYLKAQLDLILQSEDAKEGTAAFKEKRIPTWNGR